MASTQQHTPRTPREPDRFTDVRSAGALFEVEIGVSSDQVLLAETIGAALRSHGLRTGLLPWTPPGGLDDAADWDVPSQGAGPAPPGVVLVISDLDTPRRVAEVCERGRRCAAPWAVMAGVYRRPAWGAVLDAGARAVVSSSVSLDELVDTLDRVLRGESPMGVAERISLLRDWRVEERDRAQLRERMETLSAREQMVLGMLYEGTTVRAIAARLEVSEATVRSQVKAVLRKLAVASQLAAVAAVEELHEDDQHYR